MLTYSMIGGGKLIGDGDDGGGVGENDIYRGSIELVLVSPSNLYSDKEVSVSASGPSSYSTYTILLTTTNYCPNQIICNFDLRRSFYSR